MQPMNETYRLGTLSTLVPGGAVSGIHLEPSCRAILPDDWLNISISLIFPATGELECNRRFRQVTFITDGATFFAVEC